MLSGSPLDKPASSRGDAPQRSATADQLAARALLHEYAPLVKDLSEPIRAALDAMGTAPFEPHGEPRPKELLDAIRPLIVKLEAELRRAFGVADRGRERPIALLADRVQQLNQETDGTTLSQQAKVCAQELLQLVPTDSRLRALASKIVRVCAVARLLAAESKVVGMAEQARMLRDVATAAVASPEDTRRVDFRKLVERAVQFQGPYAESRRIDLKVRTWPQEPLLVKVQQSDMQRALINLLSNAIKYSYTLPGRLRAWIWVDVCGARGNARVEFENWGVPIVAEDLKNGCLFTPRYRGRYALELEKDGTGMGLWDARETARRHGGDVTIRSARARAGSTLDTEPIPHITTATLVIACNARPGEDKPEIARRPSPGAQAPPRGRDHS